MITMAFGGDEVGAGKGCAYCEDKSVASMPGRREKWFAGDVKPP